jgi:hypothetical protein
MLSRINIGMLMVTLMRVVQMTLDEALVAQMDELAKMLGTNRSAIAREAISEAVRRRRIAALEEQHRRSYEQFPVQPGEFPEVEPVWDDLPWEDA